MPPSFILNSFWPLCDNPDWRKSDGPPFIDYSPKREPDLELEYPSISSICRERNSIVNVNKSFEHGPVKEGDKIVYLTNKGRYLGVNVPHWRVVAILEVFKKFNFHYEAYEWYHKNDYKIPRNCISAPTWEKSPKHEKRVGRYPIFLACNKVFSELDDPPIIFDEDVGKIFDNGKMPHLVIPRNMSEREFDNILEFVKEYTE